MAGWGAYGARARERLEAFALPSGGQGDGDDVEAGDAVEMPDVRCSDAPSGGDGGRRHEPVVRTDVQPGRGESGPQAGVRPGR